VLFAVALAASVSSHGADVAYPTKPIRLIQPVGAGSSSDRLGRLVASNLSQQLGQQIVVENIPGAGGNLGVPIAARATPDGHTLLLISAAQTISPSLYKNLPYDLMRDFAPITQLASGFYLLLVHPSVPATSMKSLIALAKGRAGELNFASAGKGTGIHLTGELFKAAARIDVVHVPFRGTGPALAATLGGEIEMIFLGLPSTSELVRSGRLRALAVTAQARSPLVPNLPTMAEAGLPGFEATTWQGYVAPAATPPAILRKLHAETVQALRQSSVRVQFERFGATPVGNTAEEFSAHVRAEMARYAAAIKQAGMSAQ